jgi:hypothetical protein
LLVQTRLAPEAAAAGRYGLAGQPSLSHNALKCNLVERDYFCFQSLLFEI